MLVDVVWLRCGEGFVAAWGCRLAMARLRTRGCRREDATGVAAARRDGGTRVQMGVERFGGKLGLRRRVLRGRGGEDEGMPLEG